MKKEEKSKAAKALSTLIYFAIAIGLLLSLM